MRSSSTRSCLVRLEVEHGDGVDRLVGELAGGLARELRGGGADERLERLRATELLAVLVEERCHVRARLEVLHERAEGLELVDGRVAVRVRHHETELDDGIALVAAQGCEVSVILLRGRRENAGEVRRASFHEAKISP